MNLARKIPRWWRMSNSEWEKEATNVVLWHTWIIPRIEDWFIIGILIAL